MYVLCIRFVYLKILLFLINTKIPQKYLLRGLNFQWDMQYSCLTLIICLKRPRTLYTYFFIKLRDNAIIIIFPISIL